MKHYSFLLVALLGATAFVACSTKTENTPGSSGTVADAGTDSETPSGGTQCTSAREQLLVPIGKVTSGIVKIVKTEGDVTTLYVDASAGGFGEARKNPRVYVKLEDNSRVDITDKAAFDSGDWDVAFKRTLMYTNSGDTGVGKGGGAKVNKDFAAVTAADADAAEMKPEKIFNEECVAIVDRIEEPVTTFNGWYLYDEATNQVTGPTPKLTFIVRSSDGTKRFKVAIKAYNGKPDGTTTTPPVSGHFLLQVAPL